MEKICFMIIAFAKVVIVSKLGEANVTSGWFRSIAE
jgi:hypothetical protein